MNIVLNMLTAACIVFAALVPAKHALHMFQQNRYEIGRFNAWLKDNWKQTFFYSSLLCGLILFGTVVTIFVSGIVENAVLMIVLLVIGFNLLKQEKQKTYIKDLVYTARVKRQIAVMAVLEAVIIFVILKLDLHPIVLLWACLGPWILIYPMALITSPIEAAVRKSFLNEAKEILVSDKNLIKIGITGSFGKTTTKNIMQAVVSEQYNSLMTPASFNTPMGITRTIREYLKPIHQVFVCEMGADHVGDITELMEFVEPTIGVVTSIGPQHLATFGSQENITKEKMQMIERLPANGFGVLNYDNEFIRGYKISNPVETVTYGIHNEDADYRAIDIQYTQTGSSFTLAYKDERIPMETKLLGELNILNILSAIAVARHLNVSWKTIQRAVKQMKQVEHRLELKKINGYRFIDDAFNSNPVGSAMALEVLSMMPNTRFIVTPGMIDLGAIQEETNYNFGKKMKDKTDYAVLVGEIQTKPIYNGLKDSGFDLDHVVVFKTVKEAFGFIYQTATPQDTILLENDLPDAFSH